MLFTRCPACETTFRITPEALRKADGQVRCGRCARVFDAYAELRRRDTHAGSDTAEPTAAEERAAGVPREAPAEAVGYERADSAGQGAPASEAERSTPGGTGDDGEAHTGVAAAEAPSEPDGAADGPLPRARGARRRARPRAAAEPSAAQRLEDAPAGMSVARIIEQLESSGVDERPGGADEAGDDTARPADDLQPAAAPAWTFVDEPPAARRSRRWGYGCALLVVVLALQVTHHFRSQLAAASFVGPLLEDAYALVGAQIQPQWNLEQYRIVDWNAVAEPQADGRGSLRIGARIRNDGPRPQPHPHVHVQLKDRWESTVGSRIFAPAEYLVEQADVDAMMPPGHTASAELDIVDPGPDAYGFELDVCIDAEALRCAADAVFR